LVFAHRARTPEATERDVPQRRPPRGKLPSDEVLLLLSSLPLPFDFLLFGFLVSSKLYVLLLVYLSLVNMWIKERENRCGDTEAKLHRIAGVYRRTTISLKTV
jgi:hypothetical protein